MEEHGIARILRLIWSNAFRFECINSYIIQSGDFEQYADKQLDIINLPFVLFIFDLNLQQCDFNSR